MRRIWKLIVKFTVEPYRLAKLLDFLNGLLLKKRLVSYPINFSTVTFTQVRVFIQSNSFGDSDLLVVNDNYKDQLQRRFPNLQFFGIEDLSSLGDSKCSKIFWLTDRTDLHAITIRRCLKNNIAFKPLLQIGPARVRFHDPLKEKILRKEFDLQKKERIDNFGYGIGSDFENMLQFIDQSINIEGDFVEIGCFQGSSTCVLARYMSEKEIKKRLYVYDVFDGFFYREAQESLDDTWYGGHVSDGLKVVEKRVSKRHQNPELIKFFKRNICDKDSLREIDKIAFANIDVDLFEAVYAALHEVHKKIVIFGIIVIEDAGHTPRLIGANAALNEFLDEVGRHKYTTLQFESGQYICIRR